MLKYFTGDQIRWGVIYQLLIDWSSRNGKMLTSFLGLEKFRSQIDQFRAVATVSVCYWNANWQATGYVGWSNFAILHLHFKARSPSRSNGRSLLTLTSYCCLGCTVKNSVKTNWSIFHNSKPFPYRAALTDWRSFSRASISVSTTWWLLPQTASV